MAKKDIVRIGNAGGFWGDDPYALRRQLEGKIPLDYLTTDFLAELSMSILKKQEKRTEGKGYPQDFIAQCTPLLRTLVEKKTVLITNAGGLQPLQCAEILRTLASHVSLPLRIAIVEGDDLTSRLETLRHQGESFAHFEDGASFEPIAKRVHAANAYIGALPIARALAHNPHIVLCGRVTDSALTLGPLIYEFGWKPTDFDLLAHGVAAGHLIECGAQVTGGNFTDWEKVPTFSEIGFPIVECSSDGSFILTKQPHTGGLVSSATIKEQLVYETFDPQRYYTPDVTADFTSIILSDDGPHRVKVRNVRGSPPPSTLKVSIAYFEGYKVSGTTLVSGPQARKKAETLSSLLWEKVTLACSQSSLPPPEQTHTEYIGDSSTHRSRSPRGEPHEILTRFSAFSSVQEPLHLMRKLIPSLILSGPPGIAVTGGAPQISEVIGYWPSVVARHHITPKIGLLTEKGYSNNEEIPLPDLPPLPEILVPPVDPWPAIKSKGVKVKVPLSRIAYARSGDKGDTANIGVIARSPELYAWLREHLTAQKVAVWMKDFTTNEVTRYLLPSLHALNFVLPKALGGGGTRSLRIDPQGKTLAQALLRCTISVPRAMLSKL